MDVKPCKRGHTGGRYASGACIECMALRKGRKGRTVPPDRFSKLDRATVLAARADAEAKKTAARAERELTLKRLATEKAELQAREAQAWREKELAKLDKRLSWQAWRKVAPSIAAQLRTPPPAAPEPAKPEYLTREWTDSEGIRHTEYVRGRDGQPLKADAAPAPEAPAPKPPPQPKLPPYHAVRDKRPWWVQRGESQARDRKEFDEWQAYRTGTGKFVVTGGVWSERASNTSGFWDPAGIVGWNIAHEPGGPREVSTLWNRTLKDL